MDETPNADYLASIIGQPLSLAVAEVCIVQPADPIEWLSGWLYKYVESAEWLKVYKKEKWEKSAIDAQIQHQEAVKKQKNSQLLGLRISSCNYLCTLKDDPFNLWKNAITAIQSLTDASAIYIAIVSEPVWEPKPEKTEGEEDEEIVSESTESEGNESEKEDKDEDKGYDSEEEERITEEEKKAEEEEEAAAKVAAAEATLKATEAIAKEVEEIENEGSQSETGSEVEGSEKGFEKTIKSKSTKEEPSTNIDGELSAEIEIPPEKPPKPPRPIKYKKMICKYMATSTNNLFMYNKELRRKMGLLTFEVMEKGLSELHIPNVLYRKGVYFFGGLPRLGAYYCAPITLPGTMNYPPRVVGLVCADTLKYETGGSGEPFKSSETTFMSDVAKALAHAMNEDHLTSIKDIDTSTPLLIEKIKTKFQEIKIAHRKAVKKAAKELLKAQKAKAKVEKEKERQKIKEAKEEVKKKEEEEKESRKKEREAKRKERLDASEEVLEEEDEELEETEPEEETEEEEPMEEEEPEEEDEEERESTSETTASEADIGGDADEETEIEIEAGEGEEEEEEPEEPESDLEDWGEEAKEESKENEEGQLMETEKTDTEGEETETEETDETDATEIDIEETEASEESGDETSRTPSEGEEEPKVVDLEVEKKKAEKKAKDEKKKVLKKERLKLAKEGAKKIKDMQKEVKKLEKALQKAENDLKDKNVLMEKLEISMTRGDVIVKHHQLLVSTLMDHMLGIKDIELKRIKCTFFPRRRMYRVLKALLYLLGHKKHIVDDWIGARILINTEFFDALKNFDAFKPADTVAWRFADAYIDGLTGKKLMNEAPFAYLGLKWILRMKKLSKACAHFLDIKTRFEAQSKAMAAADLSRIMCRVQLKVMSDELKKMHAEEEKRLENVAEEKKKEAEEEAALKAIEDAEEAARIAALEVGETSEAETSEGGETEGTDTETELEEAE